ncbi:MAG: nucleotidyltransferase domain-containing protein [candidate division KSB1 bacterium]|nr:nucleotidyltransferase domain-containing protein [candidate division KSB1 bacterium]MDZ7303224.1 nucleotidyltransferase domain-containing protein [candidate division KSB1 bacterium]MDZ7312164.1 nucleotidyltransferase domain-containing protein [candidate division KSB1 bacterium]
MTSAFKQNLIGSFKQHFGDDLVAVVLFGSQARGEAGPESDYDIFLLVKNLPARPVERLLFVRGAIAVKFAEKIAILARTPEEFESGFPSLYLDLAVDGIVLYDTDNYVTKKLQRIQEIIKQAGLERKKLDHQLSWEWNKQPKGQWEITWEGYRELKD